MNQQQRLNHLYAQRRRRRQRSERRGVIVVLTAFCLIAVFAFVALSVDAGRMVLTETRMQNAVDAASLAAAQEITTAVSTAGQGAANANATAVANARQVAAEVAAANGVFVDSEIDVRFGRREYNPGNGTWPIQWGVAPYNVVQVVARRTADNVAQPDGQLPLAFGWSVGRDKVPLRTSATAFIEARDLVIALDFSGSMNYDSNLVDSNLSRAEVEQLLDGMWNALRNADPKWPDTNTSKFPGTGFGSVNSALGTAVSGTDTATILTTLGLKANNADGTRKFPFPQAGRQTSGSNAGLPNSKPSNATSDALWSNYINFVKNHPNSTYKGRYGYRTLMDFMQQKKQSNGYTPRDRYASEDLWRTPHYPMEGVKKGASMFLAYLTELQFSDEVGLVGFGEWAEPITRLNDGVVSIDISSNPITPEYDKIDTLQRHHQAGEFNGQTATGDGILKARQMLVGTGGADMGYGRHGARPTMLVMTDGVANTSPSGWSLPSRFNWAAYTDYDGNGTANYSTTDVKKRYAFYQAVLAAQKGITIHTLAVGASADRDLMRAIAFVGGGVFINVPGAGTAQMESQILDAFRQIASKLPPAKLIYDASSSN